MESFFYRDLNEDQKDYIKFNGTKVFNSIKNYIEPKSNKPINHWLKKSGIEITIPDSDFIKQNIDDITFAITKLPLTVYKSGPLSKIRAYLTEQLENPEKQNVVLFFEIRGDKKIWSLVNMFDNNIILWTKLINETMKQDFFKEKLGTDISSKKDLIENLDKILKLYFGAFDTSSIAAHDLLKTIMENRHRIFEEVFSETWGKGQRLEKDFISILNKIGISEDRIKNFSGEGNFVDRAGIDCAIKGVSKNKDQSWTPVQVKSSQIDALRSIPFRGISVYPTPNGYYYYESKTLPSKPISELVN